MTNFAILMISFFFPTFEQFREQLESMEEEAEVKPVRLGDASIASPFTSKVQCEPFFF
jgi:hypothetical protein